MLFHGLSLWPSALQESLPQPPEAGQAHLHRDLRVKMLCAVITDIVPSCYESSRAWQVPWLDTRPDSAEQAEWVQEAQEAHLQKDLSDGLLCAVINNNTRCYNESTEFADHLDDTLAPPYKARSLCKAALACAAPKTLQLFKPRARITHQKMASVCHRVSRVGRCALCRAAWTSRRSAEDFWSCQRKRCRTWSAPSSRMRRSWSSSTSSSAARTGSRAPPLTPFWPRSATTWRSLSTSSRPSGSRGMRSGYLLLLWFGIFHSQACVTLPVVLSEGVCTYDVSVTGSTSAARC